MCFCLFVFCLHINLYFPFKVSQKYLKHTFYCSLFLITRLIRGEKGSICCCFVLFIILTHAPFVIPSQLTTSAREIATTRRRASSSTVRKRRVGQSLSLRCPRPPLPKTSWVKPRRPSVKTATPHLSFILQTRPLNPNCGLSLKSLPRIKEPTRRRPPGPPRSAPSPPHVSTTRLRSTRDSRTTARSAPRQTQRFWTGLTRLCYTERGTASWLRRWAQISRFSTGGRIFSAGIAIYYRLLFLDERQLKISEKAYNFFNI